MQDNKNKFKDRFNKYVQNKVNKGKDAQSNNRENLKDKKRPASAFPFSDLENQGQPYKRLKRLSEIVP